MPSSPYSSLLFPPLFLERHSPSLEEGRGDHPLLSAKETWGGHPLHPSRHGRGASTLLSREAMGSPSSLFLSPSLPSRGGPSLASPRGKGRSSHSCVKEVGVDLPLYSSSLLCSPRLCSREIGGCHPFLDSREAKGGRHLSYSSLVSSPLLPERLSLFLFLYFLFLSLSLSLSLSFATSRRWPPVPFPKRGEGCLSSPFC